jgi:hypothetical protein
MNEKLDVLVELRFEEAAPHQNKSRPTPSFPAELVMYLLRVVDRAILRAERKEIDALQEAFPDLPAYAFDAMRFRLEALRGRALNVGAAHSGCLIIAGTAAALALWVLDKTLGETIKEAWKESTLHSKLTEFLVRRREDKAIDIGNDIFAARRTVEATIDMQIDYRGDALVMIVIVTPGPSMEPIPTASGITLGGGPNIDT